MPKTVPHHAHWIAARYSPAWICRWRGRRRRRQGRYDTVMLACLRHAWRRQPGLRTLLDYLDGRRACGRQATAPLLLQLEQRLPQARGRNLHQSVNLLLESEPRHAALARLATDRWLPLAEHSPPLAHALLQSGAVLDEAAGALAELQGRQREWRHAFAGWLATVRGSLCVVGNAGSLTGSGLGARIDAHRAVARFNRYRSTPHRHADVGARLDIWMCSPEFAGTELPARCPADWLVLSGCDIRYQLYHWQRLLPLLASGCRVLTVPGHVWAALVRELHAPPSAGVLLLAWLIELLGAPAGIAVTGFQSDRQPADASRGYHHAVPGQRAGARHNWPAELRLLQQWRKHGLEVLEST